ncbi:MAG: PorT family protein [Tannerella sp.]|jgi:hypothetical protein|nr:PorT family protein [Tannerella sp.]
MKTNRRQFLKTVGGLAAFTIIPRHVLGLTRKEMKRIDLKKVLIGLAVMSVMSTMPTLTTVAQQNRVGVKVGLGVTSFLDDAVVRTDGNNNILEPAGPELSNMAVNIGVFDNYSFSSRLGLQTEASLLLIGDYGSGNPFTGLGYLNIPVLIDLKLSKRFSAIAGPQIGVKVYKHDKYYLHYTLKPDAQLLVEGKNDINPIDFSLAVGVQYSFSHLVLGMRYNHGLTSVWDFKTNATASGFHLRVLQLSTGWLF